MIKWIMENWRTKQKSFRLTRGQLRINKTFNIRILTQSALEPFVNIKNNHPATSHSQCKLTVNLSIPPGVFDFAIPQPRCSISVPQLAHVLPGDVQPIVLRPRLVWYARSNKCRRGKVNVQKYSTNMHQVQSQIRISESSSTTDNNNHDS